MQKLHDVYGDKALKATQCQRWFVKLGLEDSSLKDKPCSGRPSALEVDAIKALIESHRHIPQSTIQDHKITGFFSVVPIYIYIFIIFSYSCFINFKLNYNNS